MFVACVCILIGMCNGRFGSFPGNYVRLLDETEAARLEAGDDSDDETAGIKFFSEILLFLVMF